MSFLGGIKRRKPLQVGAAYTVVTVVLVLVALALVLTLVLLDKESLIPEPEARVADAAAVPTIADPGVSDSFLARQRALLLSQLNSSESNVTGPESESTDGLDVEFENVNGIPIPAELAEWYERDSGKVEFHEWLEREPRDSVWADAVEADLRDFINTKPELLDIKVLLVECRTNACEILAIGYGDSAFRTWMEGMSELFTDDTWLQDRFEGPGEAGCGGGLMAPGIFALGCTFQSRELEAEQPDNMEDIGDTLLTETAEAEAEDLERIPLSEAMARLREDDHDYAEVHQQMEREPTDYSWSVYMETQLTEYFTSLPGLPNISIVMVACRTSFCEIQATTSDDLSYLEFIVEMPEFHQQTWHDLRSVGLTGGDIAPGQVGLLLMLQRSETIEPSD